MPEAIGLGRVVVVEAGEGGRRVLRAIRELVRLGRATAAIALHAPTERQAGYLREADEAFEAEDLRAAATAARAETAWIGAMAPAARVELATALAASGIRLVGPPAEVLRRLAAPEGLRGLARELGLPAPDPAAGEGRLVEVVVARDAEGLTRLIGMGATVLSAGGRVVLAESAAPGRWSEAERGAAAVAVRAVQAAGWVGVAAVLLALDADGRPSLRGIDPAASTAPAVEASSGVDLVRLALTLAAGGPVGAAASPGAAVAVAARVVARDPEGGSPALAGRVERLRLRTDPALRAEAAVEEGDPCAPGEVVASLVAVGEERGEAFARLAQALGDSDVLVSGRGTNKAWLAALCAHPDVRAGRAGDGRLAELASAGVELMASRPETALVAAALEAYELDLAQERARFLSEARRGRPRVGPPAGRVAELRLAGLRYRLEVRQIGPATYRVVPAGGAATDVRVERRAEGERRLTLGNQRARILSSVEGLRHQVEVDGVPHLIEREPAGLVVSPMPAVVVAIPVRVGQSVAAGEPVARIESMKVEVAVNAPSSGVVTEVIATANAQVDAGAPLVRMAPDRVEPAAEPSAPLALPSNAAPPPATPRERYLAALDELHRALLGFDVTPAEARRLAAGWGALSAGVISDDPQVLAAEEAAFSAFADVQSLFSRTRRRDGVEAKPPLEELWRYLHEPEQRGAGLSPEFVEGLRRALSHYGVALDAPGSELETALLRIQKAHDRFDEPLLPVMGILERRLASDTPALEERGPETRRLLDRLAELGHELHAPLADLASELRFRRFDQPRLRGRPGGGLRPGGKGPGRPGHGPERRARGGHRPAGGLHPAAGHPAHRADGQRRHRPAAAPGGDPAPPLLPDRPGRPGQRPGGGRGELRGGRVRQRGTPGPAPRLLRPGGRGGRGGPGAGTPGLRGAARGGAGAGALSLEPRPGRRARRPGDPAPGRAGRRRFHPPGAPGGGGGGGPGARVRPPVEPGALHPPRRAG